MPRIADPPQAWHSGPARRSHAKEVKPPRRAAAGSVLGFGYAMPGAGWLFPKSAPGILGRRGAVMPRGLRLGTLDTPCPARAGFSRNRLLAFWAGAAQSCLGGYASVLWIRHARRGLAFPVGDRSQPEAINPSTSQPAKLVLHSNISGHLEMSMSGCHKSRSASCACRRRPLVSALALGT